MGMQTLKNIESGIILILSLVGLGFGMYSIYEGYYLGLLAFAGGLFGIGLFAISLQPPFGYSSWDEWDNPYSYNRRKTT